MREFTDLLDNPLSDRLAGFTPRSPITLIGHMIDHVGQRWSCEVTAQTDDVGQVLLSAPLHGEPDALLWSMTLDPPPGRPPMPYVDAATDGLAALEIDVDANGQQCRLIRQLVPEAVSVLAFGTTGAAVTLFEPPEAPRGRVALVLGGSGGATSWSWQTAALTAARGRSAAAVAFFDWTDRPGLPTSITEIPIEIVERALDALADRARPTSVDLIGFSKGAELALIAAATLDLPLATVSVVAPTSHIWEAARTDPTGPPRSSWTYQGQPLPFLSFDAPPEFYESFDKTTLRPLHEHALAQADADHTARIRVKHVRAPLLLVAGTADSTWPSDSMAAEIATRHGQAGQATQLILDGAGHTITTPGLPANSLDGEPAVNARANRQMWNALLDHLHIADRADLPGWPA